jgi:mannosyl-oligosaccharide alpha-1,2-mannosidase
MVLVLIGLVVVFNTEAHPFEAPPELSTYGSHLLVPSKPGFVMQSPDAPLPAISPNVKVGPVIPTGKN